MNGSSGPPHATVARMAKATPKVFALAVVLPITLTFSSLGHARCFCQCVDGRMQPLCDNSSDIRPACAPLLCAPSAPGAGIDMPAGSPAAKCEQRQLCDTLGRCRLRQICR